MDENLNFSSHKPVIEVESGVTVKVNNKFSELTGFDNKDLADKDLLETFKLLTRSDIKMVDINEELTIFTKSLDVRFVKIEEVRETDGDKMTYIFNEVPDSSLDGKLLFLEKFFTDEKVGIAVFSAKDYILLRANEKYLNFFPEHFVTKEACYGKGLKEIISDFQGSYVQTMWDDVIKLNKSLYISEKQGIIHNNKYYDFSLMPISEDNQVKYIIAIINDVTEKVLGREHIRIKNDQLKVIIDSVEDIIVIADRYENYIGGNNFSEELFNYYKENKGLLYETYKVYDLDGNEIERKNINFKSVFQGSELANTKIVVELNNEIKHFQISGKPIYDKSGEVIYGVFTLRDVTKEIIRTKIIENQNKELEAIIDNLYDSIAIIDKYGKFIKINEALKEYLQKKSIKFELDNHKEKLRILGHKYFDENLDEIPLEALPSMRVLRGEKVKEQRVMVKDGNKNIHLNFDGIPIYDEEGNLEIGVVIGKDVTDSVNKNKEIERQNKQLTAIIECMGDVVTILDKNGQFIRKSKMLNNNFDCGSSDNFYEIVKKTKFYDLNDDIVPFEQTCTYRLLKGEKVKDFRSKMIKDGKEIYVSSSGIPIYDENGELEMGVMVTHDITEIILSYVEIEKQRRELEVIVENMRDGLIVFNSSGKAIKINTAFKELMSRGMIATSTFNYATETLEYGQRYYDEDGNLLKSEDLPSIKVLRGETVEKQRIMVKDGTSGYYADFNGTPIYDKNGELQYGIIFSHDVTDMIKKENKIMEQQELLYRSEKRQRETLEKALIMKDEFISLITHEFKTPLNVIYSAIQLIEHVYSDSIPERVNSLIGNIKQNTFRQLRLVNNLLDVTRLNAGHVKLNMKNIDIVFLTGVIAESVKLYVEQKNINLSFSTNVTSKIIALDDEKYERIILNLLSNAIKFTPEYGSINVEVLEDLEKKKISIVVGDTGIGIPKEKLKVIFERFGQVESDLSRQAEGTGIGLSLVKLLVDNFKGEIKVESELGVGSVFTVTLPIRECKEIEEGYESLDADSRLITAINVEFSDIYF